MGMAVFAELGSPDQMHLGHRSIHDISTDFDYPDQVQPSSFESHELLSSATPLIARCFSTRNSTDHGRFALFGMDKLLSTRVEFPRVKACESRKQNVTFYTIEKGKK